MIINTYCIFHNLYITLHCKKFCFDFVFEKSQFCKIKGQWKISYWRIYKDSHYCELVVKFMGLYFTWKSYFFLPSIFKMYIFSILFKMSFTKLWKNHKISLIFMPTAILAEAYCFTRVPKNLTWSEICFLGFLCLKILHRTQIH